MQSIIRIMGVGDINVFMYLNHRLHCKILDKLMPLCTFLGGATFTILISVGLIIFGKEGIKVIAARGLIALAVSFAIGTFLKKILGRPRPYMVIQNIHICDKVWKDYSFPSGHTAASFSLAINYSLSYPQFTIPLALYGVLVGTSRVYLGHHYPTDILAGAILGTLTAAIIHMF